MSVIKPLIFITFFTILQHIDAQDQPESVQTIDHPNKNEYIRQNPGSDKHNYGYELKENQHFHHTTTEEDGVRLGCYGYSLNGKMYSTQYVADIKGYRPVYTYDAITVYPKSGGTREASFVGSFDESEKNSENIRYFFPDGCRGDRSNMVVIPAESNSMPPPIILVPPTTPRTTQPPPSPPITTPRTTASTLRFIPPVTKTQTPPTQKTTTPGDLYLPPANNYLPPNSVTSAVKGNFITKNYQAPITTPRPTPVVTKKTAPPVAPPKIPNKPIVSIPPVVKNSCDAKSCCNDDALPKLVIPINLSTDKKGSGCPRFAKLIVPADSVGMESLKTLLSNPSELAKTIIKSLS